MNKFKKKWAKKRLIKVSAQNVLGVYLSWPFDIRNTREIIQWNENERMQEY